MTRVEECLSLYKRWCERLNISTISDLNRVVSDGKCAELINLSEIWHEQNISEIAEKIHDNAKKKLILISGPSSSGKTSFAAKLKLHLRVLGIEAVTISLDDYFIKTEDMPLNDEGKADFEAFESIDYKLFNEHIKELIAGREVSMPHFDFEASASVTGARKMQLKKHEIIIVEGIHALNEKLGASIPDENKYRIYCTALTSLSYDDLSRISSSKTRLIRRTVRDFYFRNTSPSFTFELWPNVEKGAQKNIYPYTDGADIVFNSSLLYEFGVYNSYLEEVFKSASLSEEHEKLRGSMFELTEKFLPISEGSIPPTSIIREFIGGSTLF